jgi:hypothetical protein
LHGKIDEMHAYTVSLEAKLKEPVPTSCSTCELHALKNLKLAHYVDRLRDENDELRKMMGWLSGHEPQLRMMMETYKRQNRKALGSEKVGEASGEGRETIGDILAPPKTYHKNTFTHKPNQLRNKLDTNLDPPIFPHSTDDFQKPIKFKSTLGNVFFGKERKNPSEEKPIERPNEEKPVEKPSGEKPSEQPQPKTKPKLVRFHCDYCGRDGHKGEFCFKRKREEKMAKEWANKDKYHPSIGVLEPCVHMPRAKAILRMVPAWGDRKAAGGDVGQATPVRLVQVWADTGLVFVLVMSLGLVQVVVVLVVGLESLQVVSLLGVLPLMINMGTGGVVALRWRGGMVHGLLFVFMVLFQLERVGSLVVVTVMMFVEVALVGEMFWIMLTPL